MPKMAKVVSDSQLYISPLMQLFKRETDNYLENNDKWEKRCRRYLETKNCFEPLSVSSSGASGIEICDDDGHKKESMP